MKYSLFCLQGEFDVSDLVRDDWIFDYQVSMNNDMDHV